jgi:hypothetical protein
VRDPKHARLLRVSVAPTLRLLGASLMADAAEDAAAYIDLLESQLKTQLGIRSPRAVGPNLQNIPLSDRPSRLSEEVKQAIREGHVVFPRAPGPPAGFWPDEDPNDELYTNKRHELIAMAAQAAEQIGEDELEDFARTLPAETPE